MLYFTLRRARWLQQQREQNISRTRLQTEFCSIVRKRTTVESNFLFTYRFFKQEGPLENLNDIFTVHPAPSVHSQSTTMKYPQTHLALGNHRKKYIRNVQPVWCKIAENLRVAESHVS